MNDKLSHKGAWLRHVTNFKCWSSIQEWLKLELSNFVHGETISSLGKGMINCTQKGSGLAHVIHFCSATVDLEKFSITCC